ncbi:MAG: class I SAM-dependent DNA methyltransferase [Bacillota bacterium]
MKLAEPYSYFARLYDRVMRDVGYDLWTDYIEQLLARFETRPRTVLDLACGTGNTTLPFAQRGYAVTGVDRSPEMLAIARRKTEQAGLSIPFIQADMRHFVAASPVDLVTCLYDSLNYVLELDELTEVGRRVSAALNPGGLFIFDVNSAHRLSHIPDTTMFVEDDGFSLVWENQFHKQDRIWQINLTGFVRSDGDLCRQFKEVHKERAYTVDEVTTAITRAGLRLLGAYSAYSFDPPGEETARIYFVAGKAEPGQAGEAS